MTALLLSALLLPAFADVDPEPHGNKGIVVHLVAKKSTYKLDFGGKKKDDYVNDAKNGSADAPKVDLELVITNYTNEALRIRSTGSTNRLTIKLEGEGAVTGSATSMAVRVPIQ